MKKTFEFIGIVMLTVVLFLSIAACNNGIISGGDNDIATVSNTHVMKMYNELKAKKSGRSVVGLDGISTAYKMARVDKLINGISGPPSFHPMENWNWDGVTEGVIKLDNSGLNGDGLYIWVFVSIQNNEYYVIYANNDAADQYNIGVTPYSGYESQIWFFRWE